MFSLELEVAAHAAVAAGRAIIEIYSDPNSDFSVEKKADNSPLTIADRAAHQVIVTYLSKLDIPILSEEGAHAPYSQREAWRRLWIVDPLDGTKEFIKRNGEFTVNIALVEDGVPVGGALYVPVSDELYLAQSGVGAYLYCGVAAMESIDFSKGKELIPSRVSCDKLRVVASRSHLSEQTEAFVDGLRAQGREVEFVSKGSSIKIALIATGEADVYPRFAPTMEWDTAAGDALLRAQGSALKCAESGEPLRYNKENLLNPFFIADFE
ncbi:MAG: 3'(2'),5'-bisphosphate nucleotidase CysQ [Rikenellaceae bacterium]